MTSFEFTHITVHTQFVLYLAENIIIDESKQGVEYSLAENIATEPKQGIEY